MPGNREKEGTGAYLLLRAIKSLKKRDVNTGKRDITSSS
jgi:hypothetical protein